MTVHRVPPEALRLWRTLAGDDTALTPGSRTVVRGARGLAPAGWTGVLRLGDAVVVEAGAASATELDVLLSLQEPTDVTAVRAALRPVEVLGPALLHHLPAAERRRPPVDGPATDVVDVATLADWLDGLDPDEVEESGIGGMAAVVVATDGDRVLGAAGHHEWPCDVAHMGVLVAPWARGRGVGTTVASAAVARAARRGLFPQWRAHVDNGPSRGIARALGMRADGAQLSLRLATGSPGRPATTT